MSEPAGDWRREGDSIVRDIKFDDFAQAMAYVNNDFEMARRIDGLGG